MFAFYKDRRTSVWASLLYILIGLVLAIFPGFCTNIFSIGLAVVAGVFSLVSFLRIPKLRALGEPITGPIISGVVLLALCLFAAIWPGVLLSILPVVLGVLLIVEGSGHLPLVFAARRAGSSRFWLLLAAALLPIVLGALIVINPFGQVILLIRVFGISLVVAGVCDLVSYFSSAKKEKDVPDVDN